MRSLVFGVIMVLGCTTAAHGISVTVQVTPAQCGLSNGTATAQVQGGQLPYTYQWNTGATTSALSGLAPGTYSVTVTDAIGDVAVGSGVVQDNSLLANIWPSTSPDCGGCSGMAWINEGNLGGTPPYSYSLPTGGMWDGNHDPAGFGWLCWGDHTIIVSDANGCSVEVNFSIGEQDTYYWPPIVDTYPACGAQANGSIALGLYSMGDPWSIVVQGPGGFDSTYVLNAPGLITGLAPGSYGVFSLEPSVCALPNSNVFVGSIPEPCGSITGVVFNDVDGNCAQDTDDIGLPFRLMTLEPGPHHAFTDSSGQFAFSTVEFGSFAVSQPLYNESQLCPPDMPIAVTVDGASPSANLLIADSSHTSLDLEMTSVLSTMRPGFVWGKEFRVRNLSPYPSGPVTITVNYDPTLDPVTGGSGGVATWALPAMPPYANQAVVMQGALSAGIPLGTTYAFTAAVTNTLPEQNLVNNTFTVVDTVVGSFDPNDKLGATNFTRSGTHFILGQDEWIDYTVRFQNTGTDTAFTVVVRDTLDAGLDLASLDIIGASHAFTPSFDQDRVLIFTFDQILLPDSSTDQLASQGHVAYRIAPHAGIMVGDEFVNSAAIYFDFNEPIITNTVTHVVETGTGIAAHTEGTMRLAPNPAGDVLWVLDAPDARGGFDLITADGRRVQVPFDRAGSTLQLDVRGLAPGVYVLRTASGQARFVKR